MGLDPIFFFFFFFFLFDFDLVAYHVIKIQAAFNYKGLEACTRNKWYPALELFARMCAPSTVRLF
jgi:hypothetical protein